MALVPTQIENAPSECDLSAHSLLEWVVQEIQSIKNRQTPVQRDLIHLVQKWVCFALFLTIPPCHEFSPCLVVVTVFVL